MSSRPPPFKYEGDQLQPGQIRLLWLCPDKQIDVVDGQPLLNLVLEKARLPTPTDTALQIANATVTPALLSYDALSYTWGDETIKKPVLVNGAIFKVTLNLFSALLHLAHRRLWVDAICINQKNLIEKGPQLGQMTEIYRQAQTVFVFLGWGDETTDLALTCIDEMGQKALDCDIFDLPYEQVKLWPNVTSEYTHIKIKLDALIRDLAKMATSTDPNTRFSGDVFRDITYRPWFERAWILQEVTVPEGNVILQCQTKQIYFDIFAAGLQLVNFWINSEFRNIAETTGEEETLAQITKFQERTGMMAFAQFPDGTDLQPVNPRASTTLGTRRKYRSLLENGQKMSLMSLLTRSYTLDTAEPLKCREGRDKIYALAGIADDMAFLGDSIDFCKPTQTDHEVYILTARHLINKGHLDILSLCRGRNHKLPSWVPDWSKRIRQPWGGYIEDGLFRASGDLKARQINQAVDFSIADSKDLLLDVIRVDTLARTGSTESWLWGTKSSWMAALDRPFDYKAAARLFDTLELFLSKSQRSYIRDEVLYRIAIGGKQFSALSQPERASIGFIEAGIAMRDKSRLNNHKNDYLGPSFAHYQNGMLSMHGSTPILSSSGYVGLGPADTIPGDVICIPLGAHVPYIFRIIRGTASYQLIGEAYVEGIMDGECAKEQSLQIETLKLQGGTKSIFEFLYSLWAGLWDWIKS